jgi:1-deoxyxylulose-5-phosphate synthase
MGVIPWSPLARGRLTRDWDESTERMQSDQYGRTLYSATLDADRAVAAAVARLAESRGLPRAQIALAWMLHKPVITAPIVGATKPHHLEDAVAAVSLKLSAEEIAALEAPYVAHEIAGHA